MPNEQVMSKPSPRSASAAAVAAASAGLLPFPSSRTQNSSPPVCSAALPDRLRERHRESREQRVAGRVAEQVVVALEAVEVEEHERQRLRRRRDLQARVEVAQKAPAVAEPRQSIRQRLVRAQLERAAKLQLGDDLAGERVERLELLLAQAACDDVVDRERADPVPRRRDERGAGVEADPRPAADDFELGEARVLGRVVHDQKAFPQDRVRAEAGIAGRLAGVEAHLRLEPLAVGVDEADRRDGRRADVRGQPRDVVERGLRRIP